MIITILIFNDVINGINKKLIEDIPIFFMIKMIQDIKKLIGKYLKRKKKTKSVLDGVPQRFTRN